MPTETSWKRIGQISPDAVGDLDLSPPGFEEEGESLLARTWKILAAQSALWVVGGIALVAGPEPGPEAFATVLALFLLVDALLWAVGGVAVAEPKGARRWLVVEAVLGFALGMTLLWLSDPSWSTVLYVIAAWALANGVVRASASRRLPLSGGRELLLLWSGIFSIVCGLVLCGVALFGGSAPLGLMAGFAIVAGVMQSVLALELRALTRG